MENFDILALSWDDDPRRVERAKVFAEEIMKAVPHTEEMKALEYGCGTGLLSFNLQQYLNHITLMDSSKGMLNMLSKKIEDAKIINMTPKLLDLSKSRNVSDRFDIVYTLLALHHIVDIDSVLDCFAKMLNPLGYLCIADLDKEDGSFHGDGFEGHNGFKRFELENRLLKYGFDNISYKICYENIIKQEDGTEKKYPMFLMVGQKKFNTI